ncbi:MAG TPA: hypothetical protein VK775_02610 [Chthoniobacterales bacterium]|jgi:hypothetical protein|nr:hypothetical protein [Chthoniobacterales bacterium]
MASPFVFESFNFLIQSMFIDIAITAAAGQCYFFGFDAYKASFMNLSFRGSHQADGWTELEE